METVCPIWNSIAESASHPKSSTKCKNDWVKCSRSWSPKASEHKSIVVSSDKSSGHDQICDEFFTNSGSLLDRENLMYVENGEPMKEKVTLEGVNNIRELETVVESRATWFLILTLKMTVLSPCQLMFSKKVP